MTDAKFLDRRLFKAVSDPAEQRSLFRRFVHNVIIEGTSHCNRKCGYCPVADSTRHITNTDLDVQVFEGVIEQLASIDYEHRVCLNLYNEPMSQLALLLDRIRHIRSRLPKSHIYFSTNGDYLNRETLDQLHDAGLTSLIVTIHMPLNKPYDDKYVVSRFVEIGVRCSARIKIKAIEGNSHIYGDMLYRKMAIEVFSINYYKNGFDRAGSVAAIKGRLRRRAPCIRPFSDFTIAYDGNVFPCCQFFPDLEASKRIAVGSVAETPDIFAIYASQSMALWRRGLFSESRKDSPCDTCGELNWDVKAEDLRARDRFLLDEFGIDNREPLVERMQRAYETVPRRAVAAAKSVVRRMVR